MSLTATDVSANASQKVRYDWTLHEAEALFELPFPELLFLAQQAHRANFDAAEVQLSTLLSIKTGACPEDCAYCPQSSHHNIELKPEPLMDVASVVFEARAAKASGATRYCMGAAWRAPNDRQIDAVCEMVTEVAKLGMETCMTLGMLTPTQASKLADAGLDYYNHNIDTSEEYYKEITTTRTFDDRLDTISNVRDAGMNVCCGGIIGMGETRSDRAAMLTTLATLPEHPESVPINQLIRVPGTPLDGVDEVDPIEFVRTIAVAKVMMPASSIRLSAGREEMSDELQALCLAAGANSIFVGTKLLTRDNPTRAHDDKLIQRLGMRPMPLATCP
ncbi:MAG: biotin synthase BioB [Ilumatobacter sp.]|uniref:biotin synthase BioB n=1 Tax=Ilumatobacter sp. TaxID=1967498 RepID=UPI003919A691